MRAVRFHTHGGPAVLAYEDAPDPSPTVGEALIRVRACSLNHRDIWAREGRRGTQPFSIPLPCILGADIAGVVEAVPGGAHRIAPGNRVMVTHIVSCGQCRWCLAGSDHLCSPHVSLGAELPGGYAERVAVPVRNLFPIPDHLSFEEASTFPLVLLTVWPMLVLKGRLRAGETVLVHAAGSGIGSIAIQLAKAFGARVLTTAGSDAKLEKARELGADETINYLRQDFVSEVMRLTAGQGVDLVLEHVGSTVFQESLRALACGGRLVTCGATAGSDVHLNIHTLSARQVEVHFTSLGGKGGLAQALDLVRAKTIRPVISSVLPLREARRAHELMEQRMHFGKIVLVPD